MNVIPRHPIVVGLLLVLTAVPAAAAPTAAERCASVKLDAAGRAVIAHVACEARARQRGLAPRPECHGTADLRFDAAFDRIEGRGGCAFPGDESAVDGMIDELVDTLLTGASGGGCGAAKLRAAARKVFGELRCARTALRRGVAIDPACRQGTTDDLVRAFAQAERRFACDHVGDADAVGAASAVIATEIAERLIAGPNAVDPKPSNLTAAVDGLVVKLGWSLPAPASGRTHVRIVRRLNTPPVDADDPQASPIFFGTATETSEPITAFLPTTTETARVYHYAAFGCTGAGICETTGDRTTLAPTLVQTLRGGGYVLHWRHSAADVCSDQTQLGTAATTSSPDWWKSCDANCGTATARQLNATGVQDATTIGQALDGLGIPIGRVVSSEFCRNVTTAQLMDFGPTIELAQGITFFVYDEANRCTASYDLIHTVPTAGTNTAVIGHAGFTGACPVLSQLAWSEAAIFKPDGLGDATFVTRVPVTGWAGLQ